FSLLSNSAIQPLTSGSGQASAFVFACVGGPRSGAVGVGAGGACLLRWGGAAGGAVCFGLLGRRCLPSRRGRRSHKCAAPTRAPLPQGRCFHKGRCLHRICAVLTGAGLLPQGLGRLLLLFLLVWEARPRGELLAFGAGVA